MHINSCVGEWQLAANPVEHIHRSAKLYLVVVQGIYTVTNFMKMEEVDFKKGSQ